MARAKNSLESVQITVSVTPQIRELIEKLTDGGLYGKNPAETANTLIGERIKQLLASKELER